MAAKVVVKSEKESQIERILTTWGVIVVVWSIFRANLSLPLWASEFIAKPLVFLVPIAVYIYKFGSGNSWVKNFGFPVKKTVQEFVLALGLMIVVFATGVFMLVSNKQPFLVFLNQISFLKATSVFSLSLVTATVEEIVGRGFLFNYLFKSSRNFLMSLFVSSTLFFVLYLPGALTMHVNGQALFINLLMNFLLSFMAATLFYVRGNILAAIGFHAGVLLWFDLLLGQ